MYTPQRTEQGRLTFYLHRGHRGEYDKSAIVKHSSDLDHVIDWDQARIIAPVYWYTRRIREAIKIHTTLCDKISVNSSAVNVVNPAHSWLMAIDGDVPKDNLFGFILLLMKDVEMHPVAPLLAPQC